MPYTNSLTKLGDRPTKSPKVARTQQSSSARWTRVESELLVELKESGLPLNQICKQYSIQGFPTRSANSCAQQYNLLKTNPSPKIFARDKSFLNRIYREVLRKMGDSARKRLLLELKVANRKPEGDLYFVLKIKDKLTEAEIYDDFPDIICSVNFNEARSGLMRVISSSGGRDKDLMENLLYVLEIDNRHCHQERRFGEPMILFTYLPYLTSMQERTPLS
jgi:hypothetical protein